MYIHVLYSEGSPTVRYTTFFPDLTSSAISLAFFLQYTFNDCLSLIIGKIKFIVFVDLVRYDCTTERAMLGLPSFAVGANMTSAFLMSFTALTVSSSGSPGPQPTQERIIYTIVKAKGYLNQKRQNIVKTRIPILIQPL